MLTEAIAQPKKAYGLKPGEIVSPPDNNSLYRYIGIRKGLPGNSDIFQGDVLVFESGCPVRAAVAKRDYSYLVVDSDSKPNKGDFDCLDCTVRELTKRGNIPEELWMSLRNADQSYLDRIRLKTEKGQSTTLWQMLYHYARQKKSSEKIALPRKNFV